MISERQEKILDNIIRSHIKTAKPISSDYLNKNLSLGVCPATIRNEMQRLTESGYLDQPYTSAGRIPTSKGYRFFVDKLLEKEMGQEKILDDLENYTRYETYKVLSSLAKELAKRCSGLAFACLSEEEILLEEGWKDIFQNPEFFEENFLEEFVNTVRQLEKDIQELNNLSRIEVYIGEEKSFLKSSNFSLIISKSRFPKNEEGVLALLGPKRMPYDKNIRFLNSIINSMEKL